MKPKIKTKYTKADGFSAENRPFFQDGNSTMNIPFPMLCVFMPEILNDYIFFGKDNKTPEEPKVIAREYRLVEVEVIYKYEELR